MAVTVELTRFTVAPDKVEEMLAARPGMVADFDADREGFLGARLVRLPNDEWLDVVEWRSEADFTASRAKGPNLPGIAAFFATISGLVSDELGTLA
ncbi:MULTISPECIES: antibiotic biosynthesis monooxygenase family protein [unclassified Nocardia]|uniref:antibiotic biosynthesis monooxygenase family protein n=1 Tax=unclassified Nocardia TaxID=2637762 RepID=UPI002E2222E6|nr:antibiotic biosynthesis monooxygenase [Nocardia sp. NBC_01009]